MATINKKTRMSDLLQYKIRITSIDGRSYIGQLLAFDAHLNLVLGDTEELRPTKKSLQELKHGRKDALIEEKRSLGLVILRGEQIVSFSIESPPPQLVKDRVKLDKGKGQSRPLKTPVSQKNKHLTPMGTRSPFKRN